MHGSARSNTALFPDRGSNEANIPAIENTARATTRFPCAQPHTRRASRIARSTRPRPASPRIVAAAGRRYGLKAGRRLKQKAEFERLLREGVRRKVAGYLFYMGRRESGRPRLGILVTRKHAAEATERNRLKRCIREAFRLEQERLGPLDVLVRPPYAVKPSAHMIASLREMLVRLSA
jgi:ribonuclease P protein component